MRPGSDQIVVCPQCGKLEKYRPLTSENNFGTRIWTDGKQSAPMLSRPPAVVQCRHCAKPYWLAFAKEIRAESPPLEKDPQVDPDGREPDYVQEASEEGYHAALEATLAKDRAAEKLLRTFVWWRGNDPYRERPEAEQGTVKPPHSKAYRRNLEALSVLLIGTNPNERLMQAEAMRELGEFATALRLLSNIPADDYDDIIQIIRELCDRADAGVQELLPKSGQAPEAAR
jgi:hypothetical protein